MQSHYDSPISYDTQWLKAQVQEEILNEKLARQSVCLHTWVAVQRRGTEICMRCQLMRQA